MRPQHACERAPLTARRVYGGRRRRLGAYRVVLDGHAREYGGFRAGEDERADAVLYANASLPAGYHALELVNVAKAGVLDLNRVGGRACCAVRLG